jgi:hypothetical protein
MLREDIKFPDRLRSVLQQRVSKVECWVNMVPYGPNGRQQSVVNRGLIHLRRDVAVVRVVLSGNPSHLLTLGEKKPSPFAEEAGR